MGNVAADHTKKLSLRGFQPIAWVGTGQDAAIPRSQRLGGRMALLRGKNLAMRIVNIKDCAPQRRPEDLERIEDGLRKGRLGET
jgi:hypothetical protein